MPSSGVRMAIDLTSAASALPSKKLLNIKALTLLLKNLDMLPSLFG
ncbi:hypothetical protein MESS4_360109 [Mesorhizobium sp. STM 4661]|nr:hypothetical protein MESS4_360109 [Mesorhizobium sp. STM 4661]